MVKLLRIVKNIISLCVLILLAVTVAVSVYCYRHKDEIVQKFFVEASQQLQTPIQVGGVAIETVKSFPHIVLVLKKVALRHPAATHTTWMKARSIKCAFNLLDLLQGTYALRHVVLVQGRLDVSKIPKHLLSGTPLESKLCIKLHELLLRDMEIVYQGKNQQQHYHMAQMEATLKWQGPQLSAHLYGHITQLSMQYREHLWRPSLQPTFDARLTYDPQRQNIALKTVRLQQDRTEVVITGNYALQNDAPLHWKIKGKNITPTIGCQWLNRQPPAPCPWRGTLDCKLQLDKPAGRQQRMALKGTLQWKNVTYSTPYLSQPILAIAATSGRLSIPQLRDPATAVLHIDQVTGQLLQSPLAGSITLRNFSNPQLHCTVQSQLDLAPLNALLRQAHVQDIAGQLTLDGQLTTSLATLFDTENVHPLPQLTGTIQLSAVQGEHTSSSLQWKDLNGQIVLQDHDLQLKTLSGSIGQGNFSLRGTLQRWFPILLSASAPIAAQAKLYADYLDLDALLNSIGQSIFADQYYLAPQWTLALDCDIQQLRYRRFQGKNVRGKLNVRQQRLTVDQATLNAAGGKVALHGYLDTQHEDISALYTKLKLRGVDLRQLFYMCENFHQSFITDQHLQGQVVADYALRLSLDRQGKIDWKTLCGEGKVQLHHGALSNFPPIQRLRKYVAKEALANLRFSTLSNAIKIQDGVVHIPPMEIHSNITRMKLSGTHTLEGQIDYRLEVPVAGLRQSATLLPEHVAEDVLEDINAFLRIKGTTDHYRVLYDTKAFQRSLADKLKKHGNVVKQILQGQYKRNKQKTQELTDDDYFDFE